MIDQSWVDQFASRLLKKFFTLGSYKACLLIIWQKHTVNNYPIKLRLKVKFFWSDKNGVVGSKLSFQKMSVIPQTPELAGGGGRTPPWSPARALPWTRWGPFAYSRPPPPPPPPPKPQILDPPLKTPTMSSIINKKITVYNWFT